MKFFRALFLCCLWPVLAAAAGLGIKPGEVVEFSAPLSADLRTMAGAGKPSPFTEALAAVAVPANFTPDRAWPVLVVSATANAGYNSSRKQLRRFAEPALQAGWIVVAADPPGDVGPDGDTNALRFALAIAALERLRQEWPAFAGWPRAYGGFSGGAKRSAWLAALDLFSGNPPPIGIFAGGCNEPAMQQALETYRPPRAPYLAIPIYLSSGTDDPIAVPQDMRGVKDTLSRAGFKHVRLERYFGAHELNAAQVGQALRWFTEIAEHPKP